ncbi:MAG: hypothetical protein G01um101429_970 [Parcubacteria group bacterium Gr01-1014_29]|nr:MAG: hypothetical protein G01um101429_970 [Parcubacteria group bacterium Gr01-1014_29]
MEEEQQSQGVLFEVQPTATQVTEQHADIALTGLFNVHANQISSERQAIWQRYTAMLIGNSIVLAFMGGVTSSRYRAVVGALFGIVLCLFWYGMTKSGWRVFRMRVQLALTFAWTNLDSRVNPFSVTVEYEAGHFGGWLYRFALATIALFGILHAGTLVATLLNLL